MYIHKTVLSFFLTSGLEKITEKKKSKQSLKAKDRTGTFLQYTDVNKWIFDMIHCNSAKGAIMIY